MSTLHILVIDDKQNWREALPQILQRLGGIVQVDIASNYEEALLHIRDRNYDLITVDLALLGDPACPQDADQQGFELLKAVRETHRHMLHCGVIVLTAYGTIERTKQALRDYGVSDFIEKAQFNAQRFLEIARTAIRDARLSGAEAKARTRLRLIITFNQDYLIDSELIGPNHYAVYQATNLLHLKVTDLIRRTDKLNILVLNERADLWRPEVRSIGSSIHDLLSKDPSFQNAIIAARALAQHPGDLWLQFSGPAKSLSIPFELLYSGDDYLGSTHILTRRLVQSGARLSRKTEPFHQFLMNLLKGKEILRILIVGANVDGNLPETEREAISLKTTIESNLKLLNITGNVDLLLGSKASYEEVSDALRNGGYHIFHYAGHGLYDNSLPELSGLVLHKNNTPRILTAAHLNTLVLNSQLQLVFLSCCLGARNASQIGRGDFHGMLEAVASADVPTVVGYRWTVADRAAMDLAQVFYETLWHTFSPGEALLEARIRATLGPRGRDDETWVSPVLLMQNT